ncbi:hypothetical protein EG68_09936 [Paragonimus skrjabini miyazakii]|uniref:F5/8 type C domain-containing protein n=1 Tax=Paragonimus skrjabini miyazakii TaxID=59628 RepID=A0A8S9YG92_9TREM|nr:hypothetical protein EG68_09936 [Paragonimus skrjabini miyazakii]
MTLQICRTTVSSVLNKDSKQYGKAHLFDGNPETCWNSDHGSPQWIQIHLQSPVRLAAIRVQFQGGFSGLDTSLEAWNDEHTTGLVRNEVLSLFPKDNHLIQTFPVQFSEPYSHYRLVFHSSTDFYGRITVYHLELVPTNEG